jgi:hypothetical protein
MSSALAKELETHGIAVGHGLLNEGQLAGMQRAFDARLRRQRWNDVDGYERTEPWRFMVPDVLTLAQGFVDLAVHPLVAEAVRDYVGPEVSLCEAKGWESLPTRRDFHGWHADMWYDQQKCPERIPREVKVGVYLTDVTSGAFNYVRGSHQQRAPHHFSKEEVAAIPADRVLEVTGPAGTVFLFDTSGTHRQAVPILDRRRAVFYCYHEPQVPLQADDVAYYRYHPLLLNAAFLGGLSAADQQLLGFGDKTNFREAFSRQGEHRLFQALSRGGHALRLWWGYYWGRLTSKLGRLFGRR